MVEELIFFLGEFICVLLPNLLLVAYFWWRKRYLLSVKMIFLWLVWLLYFAAVFYFTSAGTINNFYQNYSQINWQQVNLVLFTRRLSPTVCQQNILNVCLFLPLGFFMATIVKSKRSLIATFSLGFYFSLLVEISQLFNHRRSDVDDLLFNTLGTVLGWLLGVALVHTYYLLSGEKKEKIIFPWMIISVLSFAGHWLLFCPLFWSN